MMSRTPIGKARVVEAKRKPPLWIVKTGNRFQAGFTGRNAKAMAIAYAEENFRDFEVLGRSTRTAIIAASW
jgi:hypothetical protein